MSITLTRSTSKPYDCDWRDYDPSCRTIIIIIIAFSEPVRVANPIVNDRRLF